MPIWVCLTRRRTSDILELTIKKNAAPSSGVFFRKRRMGCADWAPNQRQIIIVHSHSQTHLSAACRQEAIRRCRARQGKATAQPLCGAGEERNCLWPFRQRARRRAEEWNTLFFSPASLASDSIQPTKKETPKGLFRLWSWRESNPRPNK